MKQLRWIHIAAICSVFGVWACNGAGGESSSTSVQPPGVVSVAPLANESSASAVSVVSATFDKNMNPASAGSFAVYGSQTGKLSGTYAGDGTTSLSFDPAGNFKPGEEIEVTLTQSLTSTDGAGLDQPFVYRFLVETGGGTGVFLDVQTVFPRRMPLPWWPGIGMGTGIWTWRWPISAPIRSVF